MPRIEIRADDGHAFGGYEAKPAAARVGVVVIQEIFGVNDHIASICDRLAAEGYHAVAPALFDRFEPDYRTGYSPEEVQRSRELMKRADWGDMMTDLLATHRHLAAETEAVAAVGFCLGGSLAFRMALRPGLAAAVCYYGGEIIKQADRAPLCPTQMHFGRKDASIPMEDVERIQALRPDCDIHLYDAGHGFNCDQRASYDPEAAALAWRRTLDWLGTHTAGG